MKSKKEKCKISCQLRCHEHNKDCPFGRKEVFPLRVHSYKEKSIFFDHLNQGVIAVIIVKPHLIWVSYVLVHW